MYAPCNKTLSLFKYSRMITCCCHSANGFVLHDYNPMNNNGANKETTNNEILEALRLVLSLTLKYMLPTLYRV